MKTVDTVALRYREGASVVLLVLVRALALLFLWPFAYVRGLVFWRAVRRDLQPSALRDLVEILYPDPRQYTGSGPARSIDQTIRVRLRWWHALGYLPGPVSRAKLRFRWRVFRLDADGYLVFSSDIRNLYNGRAYVDVMDLLTGFRTEAPVRQDFSAEKTWKT